MSQYCFLSLCFCLAIISLCEARSDIIVDDRDTESTFHGLHSGRADSGTKLSAPSFFFGKSPPQFSTTDWGSFSSLQRVKEEMYNHLVHRVDQGKRTLRNDENVPRLLSRQLCSGASEYTTGKWVPITAEEVIDRGDRFKCCSFPTNDKELLCYFATNPDQCLNREMRSSGSEYYDSPGLYPVMMGNACQCYINERHRFVEECKKLKINDTLPALLSSDPCYEILNPTSTSTSTQGEASSNIFNTKSILPMEKYKWQPDSCDLVAWNATLFCELLGNRTMLLIGDSTMQQTSMSLMSLLMSYQNSSTIGKGSKLSASPSGASPQVSSRYNMAPCLPQIRFEMSDYLVPHIDETRGTHFGALIVRHKPHIVIVSTGPHYMSRMPEEDANDHHHRHDSFMEYFFPRFSEDLKWMRERPQIFPTLQVLAFKTANPGHISCDRYKAPVANWTDELSSVDRQGASREEKYKWRMEYAIDARMRHYTDMMNKNNKNITTRIGAAGAGGSGLGVQYYDTVDMTPLYQRPDAHPGGGDCLHFCAPGPLNLFAHIILHKLYTKEW